MLLLNKKGAIMSTRCNIIIKRKGYKAILYHHFDGYLEGVGQDLVNKLSDVQNWNWDDIANCLLKDRHDDGYELTSCIHGDIEYLYTIDVEKQTIKYQTVSYDYNNNWKQSFSKKRDVVVDLAKLRKEKENANLLPQN